MEPTAVGAPGLPRLEDLDLSRRAALSELRGDGFLGLLTELTIEDDEMAALDALASGGLVPPLRMVAPVSGLMSDSA